MPTVAIPRRSLAAIVSASAVLIAAVPVLSLVSLGSSAAHMALHIALMNVAAPLAAALLVRTVNAPRWRGRALWGLALAQIVLLWLSHAPPVHAAAAHSSLLQAGILSLLFVAAFGFWLLVIEMGHQAAWQAIAALLLTGKLACLLGALLIFAPRPLYDGLHAPSGVALADQQLAGLLMVTACPLSYVAAAIILAAQMIADLEAKTDLAWPAAAGRQRA